MNGFSRGKIYRYEKENDMKIKRLIGGNLESNGYIISLDEACYIIDPGYNPKKYIESIKNENMTCEGILLTHHHYDHSGGVQAIASELECPVMMHILDSDKLKLNVDRYLESGDILTLHGRGREEQLKIFHTPGHTYGGICIMNEKDNVCFTGDTIFNVDLGRTDLEDGNDEEMVCSIREIIDKWPNSMTIYPGHGDPANMKTVRKINREFIDIIEMKVK